MCHWGSGWNSLPHASLHDKDDRACEETKATGSFTEPFQATSPWTDILEMHNSARCPAPVPAVADSLGSATKGLHRPEMKRNPRGVKQPTVPCDRSGMPMLRSIPWAPEKGRGVRSTLMCYDAQGSMIRFVCLYEKRWKACSWKTNPIFEAITINYEKCVSKLLAASAEDTF